MKKNKSWFEKNKLMVGIVGAVLLILIIIAFSFNSSKDSNIGNTNQATDNSPQTTTANPHEHNLNEKFSLGNFAYTIHTSKTMTEIGDSVGGIRKATKGEFLILDLTIENLAELPTYFQENVYIMDSSGKTYGLDKSSEKYYPVKYFDDTEMLIKNTPRRAELIFDVPNGDSLKVAIKETKISPDFSEFVPLN